MVLGYLKEHLTKSSDVHHCTEIYRPGGGEFGNTCLELV